MEILNMASYRFGSRSQSRLLTCSEEIQRVANRVMALQIMDFAVITGHRTRAEQDEKFESGLSKVQWPDSQHNSLPSDAIDVAPWPIDWNDSLAFARLAGLFHAAAVIEYGSLVLFRWGGDWDGDGESNDQTFMDLGHIELRVR